MKLVEYYKDSRIYEGMEVSKKDLLEILGKLDYVLISKDDEIFKYEEDDEIIGTIMGDINNIINDLKLQPKLNIMNDELPICKNPDCWFVNIRYIKYNYKPLTPETLFTFGEAIELLNFGYAITKNTWYEGMFLFLSTSEILDRIEDATSKWSDYEIEPFIIKATAQKTFQFGWTPSQEDMLSDDFIIVK